MRKVERERNRGKSPGQLKDEQFARLNGKLQARARRIANLQAELDPKEPVEILRRMSALASRLRDRAAEIGMAARADGDTAALGRAHALQIGATLHLEVAMDLRLLLPPYTKPICEREPDGAGLTRAQVVSVRIQSAIDALDPSQPLLAVYRALEDSYPHHDPEHGPAPVDEGGAVSWVRSVVGTRLPRNTSDKAILAAVRVFNRKLRTAGRRKASSSASAEATEIDRATALGKLLRLKTNPDDLARQIRQQKKAAADRLNGTHHAEP